MKKIVWLMLLSSLLTISNLASASTKVENLRTEYLKNPIGVDVDKPRFSWQITSNQKDVMQTAYQITVSTDKKGLNPIWTSAKTISDKSVHIEYDGVQLQSSTRYYWKVNVWANNKKVSSKELAFFETGLLADGWSGAQWIRHPSMKELSSEAVHFVLKTDVTIVKDNAGIIFSAKDANNMYMWSINTHDYDQPIIRRHLYSNGNPVTSDVQIGKHFTKKQIVGKELQLRIEADNNVISTYLNNKLVDRFSDTSGNLINGYVGFRAFNGDREEEIATYDNIVLTTYSQDANGKLQPKISLSEDFENERRLFEDGVTIKENGNTKLLVASKRGEYRVLQDNASLTPQFRSEFKINKTIESAKVYSSGLGVYDLFINGKRVGTPTEDGKGMIYDELKPGWTDYRKTVYYSTYDVTELLETGTNAIGAFVSSGWWSGGVAWGRYGNHPLGFMAKLAIKYSDGTSENIVSDTSWKTSMSKTLLYGDIYNGETYDARHESDWTSPDFDDSNWNQPVISTDFKGEITAFVGPTVQVRPEFQREPLSITTYNGTKDNGTEHGAINVVNVTKGNQSVELKKGQTAVYDMGQNMVGWVNFKVKGDEGTKMKFRFAEMLNDSGDRNRGNDGAAGSLYRIALRSAKAQLLYTLKGGGETYNPSTTFYGFRYCEVTATEDVTIQSLVGEVVGSVTEEGSSIATSNSTVNQLYSNILWGQRSNYLSVPTDCPQRDERMGWTGDTQVFVRAASYNSDISGFFHKWMGDMRDGQFDDGAYPNVAPLAWVDQDGNAAWAEAGLIVPWTIYLVYDNKGILEENYESMEKFMQFLANNKDDKYKYNGSHAKFGDWLSYEGTDPRYISVAYYAYAAQLMAKISAVLSSQGSDFYAKESRDYETLYDNVKAEFLQRYVNADGTLKEKSQTAYLLALKLDLFPNERAKKSALDYLVQKIADNGNRLSTGFVGTGILNQTLSELGADDTAYNLLLQRNDPSWLYSVDQGATTIWERWNSYTLEGGFNKDIGMNSFNHYAYGAVSEWMYRYMAGIELDEANPGYKHIILQPTPDTRTQLPEGQEHITWVKASYDSYYGIIESAWKMKEDGRLSYAATVPPNTTATLYLPVLDKDDKIYENNKAISKKKGIEFIGMQDGKAVLKLKSGSYNFEVLQK